MSSSAVLKTLVGGEGVFFFLGVLYPEEGVFLGVLGNSRFALDPVLKVNLGFLLVEGLCLTTGVCNTD